MSEQDFRAPPLSWAKIRERAGALRIRLNLVDEPYFPVMDVLEHVLPRIMPSFGLEVCEENEMEGAEGLTDPDGEFIRLAESVYLQACRDQGRARFTAAHELGHLALHAGVRLARIAPGTVKSVRPFERAEPQANQYAAEILMPVGHIYLGDTESDLVDRFGVSWEAAEHRLTYLRSKDLIRQKKTGLFSPA